MGGVGGVGGRQPFNPGDVTVDGDDEVEEGKKKEAKGTDGASKTKEPEISPDQVILTPPPQQQFDSSSSTRPGDDNQSLRMDAGVGGASGVGALDGADSAAAMLNDVAQAYDNMEKNLELCFNKLIMEAKGNKEALEDQIKQIDRQVEVIKEQLKKLDKMLELITTLMPKFAELIGQDEKVRNTCPLGQQTRQADVDQKKDELTNIVVEKMREAGFTDVNPESIRKIMDGIAAGGAGATALAFFLFTLIADAEGDAAAKAEGAKNAKEKQAPPDDQATSDPKKTGPPEPGTPGAQTDKPGEVPSDRQTSSTDVPKAGDPTGTPPPKSTDPTGQTTPGQSPPGQNTTADPATKPPPGADATGQPPAADPATGAAPDGEPKPVPLTEEAKDAGFDQKSFNERIDQIAELAMKYAETKPATEVHGLFFSYSMPTAEFAIAQAELIHAIFPGLQIGLDVKVTKDFTKATKDGIGKDSDGLSLTANDFQWAAQLSSIPCGGSEAGLKFLSNRLEQQIVAKQKELGKEMDKLIEAKKGLIGQIKELDREIARLEKDKTTAIQNLRKQKEQTLQAIQKMITEQKMKMEEIKSRVVDVIVTKLNEFAEQLGKIADEIGKPPTQGRPGVGR
ncbi:MAG: hypothetical protein IT381_22840 [Deltaproteobacteria bacterium]|nr:hypothetical protein [Deltaproteobacteria bacterium]